MLQWERTNSFLSWVMFSSLWLHPSSRESHLTCHSQNSPFVYTFHVCISSNKCQLLTWHLQLQIIKKEKNFSFCSLFFFFITMTKGSPMEKGFTLAHTSEEWSPPWLGRHGRTSLIHGINHQTEKGKWQLSAGFLPCPFFVDHRIIRMYLTSSVRSHWKHPYRYNPRCTSLIAYILLIQSRW